MAQQFFKQPVLSTFCAAWNTPQGATVETDHTWSMKTFFSQNRSTDNWPEKYEALCCLFAFPSSRPFALTSKRSLLYKKKFHLCLLSWFPFPANRRWSTLNCSNPTFANGDDDCWCWWQWCWWGWCCCWCYWRWKPHLNPFQRHQECWQSASAWLSSPPPSSPSSTYTRPTMHIRIKSNCKENKIPQ